MSAESGITSAPAKEMKIICSTTTAMQMRRMAALEKTKEYNIAFKCVTVVHALEKGKDDGQLQT